MHGNDFLKFVFQPGYKVLKHLDVDAHVTDQIALWFT